MRTGVIGKSSKSSKISKISKSVKKERQKKSLSMNCGKFENLIWLAGVKHFVNHCINRSKGSTSHDSSSHCMFTGRRSHFLFYP